MLPRYSFDARTFEREQRRRLFKAVATDEVNRRDFLFLVVFTSENETKGVDLLAYKNIMEHIALISRSWQNKGEESKHKNVQLC